MAQVNFLPSATIGPVSAALTTTGASAILFGAQSAPDGHDRTLVLAAIGAGAVPTAVTVDVEVSFDAQATWQKFATGLALVTAGAGTVAKVANFPPGVPARINATTLTLGSATSVTVQGLVN